MYILALETTGPCASAAIIDGKGAVTEERSAGTFNHLQHLMPMVQTLMAKTHLRLSDMTAIAVSEGPGSFTGIRIGVASARALAQVLGVKTIGVPTLKAFAYHMPAYEGLICPVLDARRNQVYAGAYRWQESAGCENSEDGRQRTGRVIREVIKGAPYDLDDFLAQVQAACGASGSCMFFGDGLKAYEDRFAGMQVAPEEWRLQRAASVARLARDMAAAGLTGEYEALKPNYMRKAEAQRKLEERRNERTGDQRSDKTGY